MNEFQFIAELLKPFARNEGAAGLQDDVARLETSSKPTIITTDTIIEGRHFRRGDPWGSVGQKLVRVNVSDCLAKAALPTSCLLNLTWNRAHSEVDLRAFVEGLGTDLQAFGIELLGGDTTSHDGPSVFSLTLIGTCERDEGPIRRSGAEVGDDLWVSGFVGDAGLGLDLRDVDGPDAEYLNQSYLIPNLPDQKIASLVSRFANASMDVSDGLIADAGHIAKASGLAIEIEFAAVPVSSHARHYLGGQLSDDAILRLVTAGDDYQTLFTAAKPRRQQIEALSLEIGVKLTRIGRIRDGVNVFCRGQGGGLINPSASGWQHDLFE